MIGPELDILAAKIAERIITPRWMKLAQAVKYAGVGKTALLSLVQAGEISGYQVNDRGDWIIDKSSIDAFHESNMMDQKKTVAELMRDLA